MGGDRYFSLLRVSLFWCKIQEILYPLIENILKRRKTTFLLPVECESNSQCTAVYEILRKHQGGRGHWTVSYTGSQGYKHFFFESLIPADIERSVNDNPTYVKQNNH